MPDEHRRWTKQNWTARQIALVAVANLEADDIPATHRNLSDWCSDEEIPIADSTLTRAAEDLVDDDGKQTPRLTVDTDHYPQRFELTEFGEETLVRQAELCPKYDDD